MKIYVTGLIAYETALKLYAENKAAVAARFPKFFLREFEKLSENQPDSEVFLEDFCIEKNTKKPYSKKNYYFDGAVYIREIRDGGIFAALWALCEDLTELREERKEQAPSKQEIPQDNKTIPEEIMQYQNIGCVIELEAIPIDQRVVEILELLKENPYEAGSEGSYLAVFPEELEVQEGLTEIGRITDSKDRVIMSGESRRFLTPPVRQAKDIANRRREHE